MNRRVRWNRLVFGWGRRVVRLSVGCGLVMTGLVRLGMAQEPPIIQTTVEGARVAEYSFVYIDAPPPPPEIKVHDILTVEVDEKSEVLVNSRFTRQRNGAFKAELKDFARIIDGPAFAATATSNPAIDATLQNRLQATGQVTDQEGITYKIAATVVDVLPNGTLVLEARKSIRSNQDFFEYRLSGTVDKSSIKPNRTVRSENITGLQIERNQKGKIFDSTKVGWGTRILDFIWPF